MTSMDPETWPIWVKFLAGWGPLGVWAGIMTWMYFRLVKSKDEQAKEQAKLKDDMANKFAGVVTAMQNSHREELARRDDRHRDELIKRDDEHEKRLTALASTFATEANAIELRHHEQENELTDRLVGATASYGDKIGDVLEQAAGLLGAVNRRKG